VWAQYTVKVDPSKRKEIMEELKKKGIPSVIYYPLPLHFQEAYNCYPCATEQLPVSQALSKCVMSLPMHPYLEPELQDHIIQTFCDTITCLQATMVA
jgi:dTDP-4-amino-4,6-dideoxygalactose transaminase